MRFQRVPQCISLLSLSAFVAAGCADVSSTEDSTEAIATETIALGARSGGGHGAPADGVRLTLQKDAPRVYCATVSWPRAPAEAASAPVVIDLNDSKFLYGSGASAREEDGMLYVDPDDAHGRGRRAAPSRFTFCAKKTGPDYGPALVDEEPSQTNSLSVAVYLPRRISTCFIGDPCDPAAPVDPVIGSCIGLRDDAGALVEAFTNASMAAVSTTSPERTGAAKERCVEFVMSDTDKAEVLEQLGLFRTSVSALTGGDVLLDLQVIELDHVDTNQARWSEGVWFSPWDMAPFALPRLTSLPDFSLVIPPVRDPVQGLHHDLGGCGGMLGADWAIAGASYAWVPKTKGAFWFDCASSGAMLHEWLHQVHFGYHQISGFQDAYADVFPACGTSELDPRLWFPDTHQCNVDPDWPQCGAGDCGEGVSEHVLSAHWDPAFTFYANYCKNGLQDFDETGVDSGGRCDALQTARVAAKSSSSPPAMSTPTP
jgi:hypothetical protein